jgi:serpin B
VDLPYAGSGLAMAVVLPDRDNLAPYERELDAGTVAGLLSGFEPKLVSLDLPRWTLRTNASLAPTLAQLGMATAFTDAADFSGMTAHAPLKIGEVLHEAFVAVDEGGTEAAAATAVFMEVTGLPPHLITVTVDRPFLFVIHDIQTGTPLFIGRVEDPTTT